MGRPKALVRDRTGVPWLARAVAVLREGGCDRVTVVLGAAAEEAGALVTGMPGLSLVRAVDWADGMGASLRAGLVSLEFDTEVEVALIHLVDLPDVTAAVVRRVAAAATGPESLARATYDGTPGHPVLLGRDHWPGVTAAAIGDQGARAFLADHPTSSVECGDLATGRDVDSR